MEIIKKDLKTFYTKVLQKAGAKDKEADLIEQANIIAQAVEKTEKRRKRRTEKN